MATLAGSEAPRQQSETGCFTAKYDAAALRGVLEDFVAAAQ